MPDRLHRRAHLTNGAMLATTQLVDKKCLPAFRRLLFRMYLNWSAWLERAEETCFLQESD